jgi:hypothetical protein
MWNPFKKSNNSGNGTNDDKNDPQSMGFIQRIAMKKMMSMSPQKREELMRKVMTPENISKNKDKILAAMEQMKASGQMSASQAEEAKRRLGL